MPSTYTLNNGIELIATGEQSGTWGDTTNTNLQLLDTALDGQVTFTLTTAGSSGSPTALPIADGVSANSEGRNRLIIVNDGGDLGATAYVQLTPNDAEKIIYIRNDLSGSRSLILFQGAYSASRDYEVPAGTTAVVYFTGGGSGAAVAANVFNNAYFDSLRLGSVSVTAILDEDDMSSDSATALATQQSIKAYVDTQITAEDLDFGGDSGTGAVDLDSQTFTIAGTTNEIETSASGQTLTIGLPNDVTIAGDLTVDTDTLYVDSTNNRVGIGVAAPNTQLEISSNNGAGTALNVLRFNDSDTAQSANQPLGKVEFFVNDSSPGGTGVGAFIQGHAAGTSGGGEIAFGASASTATGATEGLRIDGFNRFLIGLDSSLAGNGNHSKLQIGGTSFEDSSAALYRFSNSASSTHFVGYRSRSTTVGTFGTALQDNDNMLIVRAHGDDGTDVASIAADIQFVVDGAVGTDDLPGRITFNTTADGAAFTTERMRITSDGYVGIGTSSPNYRLDVEDSGGGFIKASFVSTGSSHSSIVFDNTGSSANSVRVGSQNNDFYVRTSSTEAMRIDSSQRVLIGTTSSFGVASGVSGELQIASSGSTVGLSVSRFASGSGAILALGGSGASSVGTFTSVSDDHDLGEIRFAGADGTDMESYAARILAQVDGTPGSNDMPGRLTFWTTPDGASNPTERMRISEDGTVSIGSTTSHPSLLRVRDDINGDTSANDATGVLTIQGATSTYSSFIGMDSTGMSIGLTSSSRNLRFVTNGTTAMQISTSQNTTLFGNLYLNNNSSSSNFGEIRFNDQDTSVGSGQKLGTVTAYSSDSQRDGIVGEVAFVYQDSSPDCNIEFKTYQNSTDTYTTRWKINYAGALVNTDSSAPANIGMASGTGIAFDDAGGSGTSTSNTLDSYEEGTWTPALTWSGGDGTGSWTYAIQEGNYTKIGRMVYFRAEVRLATFSRGTASGGPQISGLPFTSGGTTHGEHYAVNYHSYNAPTPTTAGQFPAPQVAATGTRINLYVIQNNAAYGNIPDPDADSQYKIAGWYTTG